MEKIVELQGKRVYISVLDTNGNWLKLLEMNVSPECNKFYRLPIMVKVEGKEK